MVVNNEPKKYKGKTHEDMKPLMLEELSKESDAVLTLAYMYAKGFKLCGEDITKSFTNAVCNNEFIENIYRKGYEDCLEDLEQRRIKDFYHKVTVDLKDDNKYGI